MKLRNKLILSCAALAAVATTAFSTTFAWYTANDSVKATGITGKTATQDATLLLISTTGKQGQWGASVSIDSRAITLDPVTYMHADKYVVAGDVTADNFATKKASLYSDNTGTAVAQAATFDSTATYYYKKEAGKYYQWDSSNNCEGAEATGGTLAGQYISFYLYFKSGSAEDLGVSIKSFNLRNTTLDEDDEPNLPTYTVLAEGTGSGSSSYSVDMLKATNVVMTIERGTEVAVASTSPVVTSAGVRTAYAADSAASYTDTIGSDANAHTYYNNVKAASIDTSIVSSETHTATATNPAYDSVATLQDDFTFAVSTGAGATGTYDPILMVKFDIYLDGWDKLCFDACRRQTFALDMEFTGAEAE
ncbi:MAG: hypothetical protein IJM36_00925 [Acholeplasmatales bacterium]|nr:hypothetical protein [Acholeplasmatales bacterium]